MPDDVVTNKVRTIERCVARIQEEFRGDAERLAIQTVEDAIVLNLQRACEASIDIAMRVVALRRLGVPQESRGAFELLESAGLISSDLAARMKRMVGFRNIAVHDYTRINRAILLSILREHLSDFEDFSRAALAAA